jgi:hypothetical protein
LPRGCVLPGTFTCYSCLCPRNHRISMNCCRTSSYRLVPVRVRLRPLFDAHCHRSMWTFVEVCSVPRQSPTYVPGSNWA